MRIDRDDRIQVYIEGGFAGGLMNTPVDITLDTLTGDVFATAKQLIETLGNAKRGEMGQPLGLEAENEGVGDFGYVVNVGNHNDKCDKLRTIFIGSFIRQPKVVVELEKLLKRHAKKSDLQLKN